MTRSFCSTPLLTTYKEVLEASNIAWPNPAMWRQLPYSSTYLAQQVSPQKSYEEAESHSHSPRRKSAAPTRSLAAPPFTTMLPPNVTYASSFSRPSNPDPFYDPSNARKTSSTTSGDISMPDYISHRVSHSGSGHINNSRRATGLSMHEMQDIKQRRNMQTPGAQEYLAEALLPAAPANTPLDGATPVGGVKTTGFGSQETPGSVQGE